MNSVHSCELLSNLYLYIVVDNTMQCRVMVVRLWIAFKFVSLHRGRQHNNRKIHTIDSCELLSNLYLYIVVDNFVNNVMRVVSGCELLSNLYLYIVVDNFPILGRNTNMLWIAFKFVSLHRGRQRGDENDKIQHSCELLSNLYLYIVVDNPFRRFTLPKEVVNCFQICIFTSW